MSEDRMKMTAHELDLWNLNREAVAFAKRGAITDGAIHANEAILDVDSENVDALLRLLRCRVYRSQ